MVGCEGDIGIKAEDLVKQDRLDPYVAIVSVLPDLDVGLIPRETKVTVNVLDPEYSLQGKDSRMDRSKRSKAGPSSA